MSLQSLTLLTAGLENKDMRHRSGRSYTGSEEPSASHITRTAHNADIAIKDNEATVFQKF